MTIRTFHLICRDITAALSVANMMVDGIGPAVKTNDVTAVKGLRQPKSDYDIVIYEKISETRIVSRGRYDTQKAGLDASMTGAKFLDTLREDAEKFKVFYDEVVALFDRHDVTH